MPPDDEPKQDTVDQTGILYNVQVPATAGYLRLGQPDVAPERALPQPNDPGGSGTGAAFKPGVVVYTTGAYQQSAATSVEQSLEKITIVGGPAPGVIASIQYTAQIPEVNLGIQTTVQQLVQTTASVGSISKHTLGNTLSSYLGPTMSLYMGGQFTGTYGSQVKMNEGQVITLSDGKAEVAGSFGSYKNTKKHSIAAVEMVRLGCCPPVNQAAIDTGAAVSKKMRFILTGLSALVSGAALTIGTGTWIVGSATDNTEILKDAMRASTASFTAATTALLAVQAVSLLLARSLKVKARIDPDTHVMNSVIKIEPNSVKIKSGNSFIALTPAGIRISAGRIAHFSLANTTNLGTLPPIII